MRITMTAEALKRDLLAGPGDAYVPEIARSANAFLHNIYRHSQLAPRIFEAARMTTAVINGCMLCKNWRLERDLYQLGIERGVLDNGQAPDENFYTALLAGDDSPLSARELLAVNYAKDMGTAPKDLASNEFFWRSFKAAYSDAEITDLTYCIAGWMAMGRLFHVLGVDRQCAL